MRVFLFLPPNKKPPDLLSHAAIIYHSLEMGDPGMYQHIRAITPMFPVMSITKAHPANVSGGILTEYCIYDH